MKTWKSFIILSLLANLLNPKIANAIGIDGFFIDSPSCSTKVYRKPTGPIDTLRTITDLWGNWGIETANFNPPAQTGETLYVYGGWNLGGKAKTFVIRGPPEYNSLDLNLNKHTACIKDVYDSTNFNSAPLKLIYWINGFPPETTQVDTGGQGLDHYYDIHAPFDTLQAQHGAQAHFRLEKVRADTVFYRNIDFLIDTSRIDAQLVKDTLYFTRDSFSVFKDIGLEQILVPDSSDSGQVIEPGVVVRNYGTINQNPWLHCKINDFYHDSTQVVAQPGIDTFYFAPCTLSQVGNWLVTSYSVLQGDVNSSNDTLQKTIVVNSVGVEESKLENKVKESLIIRPNPARNYIISNCKAVLYDALGRSIKEIEKGKNNLDLNSGVYFLKKDEDEGDNGGSIEKLVIFK